MVRRSSEKLTIDSAFRVPNCDELAGACPKLRASKFGIYGVTPFTELLRSRSYILHVIYLTLILSVDLQGLYESPASTP